jgi:hypothetical protein
MILFFETNARHPHAERTLIFVGSIAMNERRNSPRHRVFQAGTIEFNRAGGVSCTVRNLSATGACLEVESPLGIPETFDIMIGSDKLIHHCKVMWRSVHRIGVAFT